MTKRKLPYWSYRLIESEGGMGTPPWDIALTEKFISVYQVHYSPDGKIKGWVQSPVFPQGETLDEYLTDLALMQEAATKPILKHSDLEDEDKRSTLA